MTTTLKDFARKFIRRPVMRPPPPVKTQEAAYSAIFSMYDEPHGPSKRLIDLSLAAVEQAMSISLAPLGRDEEERKRLDCFPGEHFRFIAGLVRTMRPEVVVHMGDDNLTHRVLKEEKLGRLMRTDLATTGRVDGRAGLIILEGPHDGEWERRQVEMLRTSVDFSAAPILLIDGSRYYETIPLWRSLDLPKLDVTTFAHWSGTLMVELTRPH